jgi:F-type H+-transporting ATPase subunit b
VAVSSAISGLNLSTTTFRLLASGGVEMDVDRTMLFQSAIFVLLIVVLSPLLFKPVLRLFEERERRTEGARSDARVMQDKAEKLLEKYEAKLEEVRRVATIERERLRAETLQLESRILGEARDATAKFVTEGRAQLERETAKIRAEMNAQRQAIAREIGSKVLGREVAG